ncbi:MAG: hypothetical protein ACLVJU_15615 [Blautia sp.]
MVVELKWNKSAQTALNQIADKKYPESLRQYTGEVLLVGINYDKKVKNMSVELRAMKNRRNLYEKM